MLLPNTALIFTIYKIYTVCDLEESVLTLYTLTKFCKIVNLFSDLQQRILGKSSISSNISQQNVMQ